MAQQIKLNIELENGKQLSHYQSLSIKQTLFEHQSFELVVPYEALESSSETFFHKAHQDLCGKSISFSFNSIDGNKSFKFSFKAIVTQIKLEFATDLAAFFHLSGFAPTCLLDANSQRNTFLEMSFSGIFDDILGKYASNVLDHDIQTKVSQNLPYAVQYQESDFVFLSRLAAEYGEWFFYDGKSLNLGLPSGSNTEDFFVNGLQTFELSVGLQPQRFVLSHYNYLKDEHFESKSDNASLSKLPQLADFALDESENLYPELAKSLMGKPLESESELSDLVKIKKGTQAGSLLLCKGCGENPDLTLSKVINVKRKTLPDKAGDPEKVMEMGKYRLIEMTHTVDSNGNYENNFQAIPEESDYPPVNPFVKTPVGEPELALVTDHQDPEGLGRIKVKFYWSGDKNESDWIRVVTPYSGEGKGQLFTPEVDSQVLVGYEDRSVLFPVVIGNVFHKKDGFSYSYSDNKIKSISTAAGNKIILNDESGKEKILISNGNKEETFLEISFESNGKITLKTAGEVMLEAGKNMSIKAESLDMDITKDLKISAMNISLSSKQKTEIEALEISAKAKTKAELSASASVKVSGADTKVEGTGMVTIQGALVKIN